MNFEFNYQDTNYIKGFSIVLVLFAHIGKAYGVQHIQWIAAIGVSLFLIFSGYGLEKSYLKYGKKNFWIKKVRKVFVPYLVIILIGDLLIRSSIFTLLKDASIVLSNQWYISFIFIWYVIYYVSIILFEKFGGGGYQQRCLILLTFSLVYLAVESVLLYDSSAPTLRCRQMLCFPIGVMLAHKEYKPSGNKKSALLSFLLMCLGIAITGLVEMPLIKAETLTNVISAFSIIPLSFAILIGKSNGTIKYAEGMFITLGKYSYFLYLIQYFTTRVIKAGKVESIFFCLLLTSSIAILSKFVFDYVLRASNKV